MHVQGEHDARKCPNREPSFLCKIHLIPSAVNTESQLDLIAAIQLWGLITPSTHSPEDSVPAVMSPHPQSSGPLLHNQQVGCIGYTLKQCGCTVLLELRLLLPDSEMFSSNQTSSSSMNICREKKIVVFVNDGFICHLQDTYYWKKYLAGLSFKRTVPVLHSFPVVAQTKLTQVYFYAKSSYFSL